MIKFAARFPDFEIVVPLAQQLSWSYFIALLRLKTDEAFMFYARTSSHLNIIASRMGLYPYGLLALH